MRVKPALFPRILFETVFLLVGLMFMLVGSILACVFYFVGGNPFAAQDLQQRGITTSATIVEVERDSSTKIGEVNPWLITYEFEDRNGQRVRASYQTMDNDFVMPIQDKQAITIVYDPDNPSVSVPQGQAPPGNFFGWFLLMPIAFALLGLVLVVSAVWLAMKQLK